MTDLNNKKAAIIIAYKDFKDEEFFIPKEILEKAGVEVAVVSDQKGKAKGADGGKASVGLELAELKVADFDAIIFVGGPGAPAHLDNETSYNIAREVVKQEKVLAAICISPTILAKAGVLKNKKATVWTAPLDKSAVKILEENGAVYQDIRVVQDGKIITADGPSAAGEFGNKIVEVLGS